MFQDGIHGLPIEQVLANKGVKRKEMSMAEYLEKCREYALSQVDKQRADFKRLELQEIGNILMLH